MIIFILNQRKLLKNGFRQRAETLGGVKQNTKKGE